MANNYDPYILKPYEFYIAGAWCHVCPYLIP